MRCGVGATLNLSDATSFKMKMGCGKGSNRRGELTRMWVMEGLRSGVGGHRHVLLGRP